MCTVYVCPEARERICVPVPPERTEKVCYIDLADPHVSYNPFAGITDPKLQALAAVNAVRGIKDKWADSWGERLAWLLTAGILLLIENGGHIGQLRPMFFSSKSLARLTAKIKDPLLREFWNQEFPTYSQRDIDQWKMPIMNRIGQLLAVPSIRKLMQTHHPTLNLKYAIDNDYIIILNLNKGKVGEDPASTFGALFFSDVMNTLTSRTLSPDRQQPPCYIHVDEFQNVATEAAATAASELGKYGGRLLFAHQYGSQLPTNVLASILANMKTVICFAVGPDDATVLQSRFDPLTKNTLMDQPRYHAKLKRGLDHEHIRTYPLFDVAQHRRDIVIERSRRRFAPRT